MQQAVLTAIAIAGGLLIAATAPNALSLLKKLPGWNKVKNPYRSIFNSRKKLLDAGLITYEGNFFRITPKGERKLRQLELHDYQLKKPKRWDKKWRVVIFDVSEKRRPLRELLRHTLIRIGFTRLQDSVWVYPYDCEDLMTLLKADYKIGKEVLYMIVESLENDRWLREHFKLS